MNNWEKIYLDQRQNSTWPWSDVISAFYKYAGNYLIDKKKKVLELGFGSGANIIFFAKKKIKYYGIDGSYYITKKVRLKYPHLKKRLINCYFKDEYFKKKKFDIIFDRGSISLNSEKDIKAIIGQIYNKLNKNGYFFGLDWYSKNCSDYSKKNYQKKNFLFFKNGTFKDMSVFFSNKKDLLKIFENFMVIHLSEKKIFNYSSNSKFATWNIICKKK